MIRRELGLLFEREISPQVDTLVTVTAVTTAPDLRSATVSVSVYGDDAQREDVLSLLRRNRVRLQKGLARGVTLKYTPVLRFKIDLRAEQADRVLSILSDLDIPDDDDEEEDA